ncbi:type II toxin-antitoxin system ParD family antitoxin [Paraburkholderia sp. SIMBA_049]
MPAKHAISVSLTEHLASFVKTEIANGRYGTASEVVRAGLRLLEEQTAHRAALDGNSDKPTRKERADGRGRAAMREKP